MGASRLNAALDRIDRALARIESSAGARPPASDPEAEQAHRALRSKVEEAIERIDGLLAAAEQG
ncbi:MAG: hypothetical protein ACK40O_08210 [Allosphingosinicella sp.]